MKSWTLRRYFVLYGILSATFLALLIWWIYYQVLEGDRITHQQETFWTQQIETARHWQTTHFESDAGFRDWLSSSFPDLELPEQGEIQVTAKAREALKDRARRRVRMFTYEGSFLILLLVAGVTYIFWTLRKELLFEQRQSTFLAATSHELKTPITSLKLYLETLRDRRLPDSKQAEVYATMEQDIERLTDLIDRLLLAQAVVGRRRKTPLQKIDLAEEAHIALKQNRSYLDHKGFTLRIDLENGLFAMADPDQWHLIVKNLVENAGKYSGESREIEVRLFRTGKTARLEVQDHGIGIEPAEIERIFDRFYRVGNEDTRAARGTGLGLFLVRAIARSFGGRAHAASPGPGKGATFTVEIPRSRDSRHG